MPTPVIFQKTPFGFNTIELGSLTIYTGKVRIKGIEYTGSIPGISVKYVKGNCILSFETTNRNLANILFRELGRLCKEVAEIRLKEKWRWLDN